jgi:hypothetical protein
MESRMRRKSHVRFGKGDEETRLSKGRKVRLVSTSHTTDLILVDGMEYIETGSGSLEVGVSTALEMLRKVLLDDYRVRYESHQLAIGVQRGDGEPQALGGVDERLKSHQVNHDPRSPGWFAIQPNAAQAATLPDDAAAPDGVLLHRRQTLR